MPEVDRHRPLRDEGDGLGHRRPGGEPFQARTCEREQHRVDDTDEDQRGGRRVDVRHEVGRVHPAHEGEGEHHQCCARQSHPDAPRQRIDPAIGEHEPELLHRQPDEQQVRESDRGHTGRGTDDVDRNRRRAQHRQGAQRGRVMTARHDGQQGLTHQEHAEEPQRLTEAVAGLLDQRRVDARRGQRGQKRPHTGDRHDGRYQQSVQPAGDESRGIRSAHPGAAQRDEPGESADHEEQGHHLQCPAHRQQPGTRLAGIGEHGAIRRHCHPDHECVEHDDSGNAERADEVDRAVAGCSGYRHPSPPGFVSRRLGRRCARRHHARGSSALIPWCRRRSPARRDRRRRRGSPPARDLADRASRTPCRRGSSPSARR